MPQLKARKIQTHSPASNTCTTLVFQVVQPLMMQTSEARPKAINIWLHKTWSAIAKANIKPSQRSVSWEVCFVSMQKYVTMFASILLIYKSIICRKTLALVRQGFQGACNQASSVWPAERELNLPCSWSRFDFTTEFPQNSQEAGANSFYHWSWSSPDWDLEKMIEMESSGEGSTNEAVLVNGIRMHDCF